MEKHYVYIIYSDSRNLYYKGYSKRPYVRLLEHNEGKSKYTKDKGPWELIFLQVFSTKSEALKREKSLKRSNSKYLMWVIQQDYNIVG